jgi:Co/Zn/Cd efflux system component
MQECCEARPVHDRQRGVLRVVLAINVAMFLVEAVAGLLARSTALLADSADMLGDAIVYGFSLYVIARGPVWQARAALLKATVMAAFGAGVLVQVGTKLARGLTPDADVMAGIGLLALIANASVLAFLWRHRADDLNMRSVWLCSRNDVIANAGVLLAAGGVALTGSGWPDIAVGVAIAALFMTSAVDVGRAALQSR